MAGRNKLLLYFFPFSIQIFVKQINNPGSMYKTGCSGLVHGDDPEGWDGEGGVRGVQDGEHMYSHGWLM